MSAEIIRQMREKLNGGKMAIRKQNFEGDEQKANTARQGHIDVSLELLRRLENIALQQKKSVNDYLEPILEQVVSNEEKVTRQSHRVVPDDIIERIYRVREQVARDSKGQLFEDSAERVRQQREERAQYLEQIREQSRNHPSNV